MKLRPPREPAPVATYLLLFISVLVMLFGLAANGLSDVVILHGLLPVIFIGQLVLVVFTYLGRRWALIATTLFVTVLFILQLNQFIKDHQKLVVFIPFVIFYTLLGVLWTKNREYFD